LPDGLLRWIAQHLAGNVAVAVAVRRLLREPGVPYDVVHANGALSALLLSIRRTVPIVYTEHDATPWACRYRRWYERWMRRVIYRTVNVVAFKRVDRVVTVFPTQAGEISRYWGIAPGRTAVIPNGTDGALFRPGDVPPARGARDPFERFVLFVGSLVPRKCPDLLLDALAETETNCVFVGDGPMRAKLERRASELGLGDRVAFLGSVAPSELPSIYERADALVLPTVSDTFPLVALEAMACGTPVLGTRVSGLPEMIEDWSTGFLVKPGDVGQLAMGIRFLTGDDALRERMGANARRLVHERFLWSSVADRYLAAYGDAVGAPDPSDRDDLVGELELISAALSEDDSLAATA
jgi:glycosyltransferase involved in cell wall biosynthesis